MSISRRVLFGKLNLTLFKAVESAAALCKLRGNPYIELAHWLHQLQRLPDSDWSRITQHFGIAARLDQDISAALHVFPAGATSIGDFSPHIETAIERAWSVATLAANENRIRGAWLVTALLETPELRCLLLNISSAFSEIPLQNLAALLPAIVDGSPESNESAHDAAGLQQAVPGEASRAFAPQASELSPLAQYCADLTERARAGLIDPVIGREHEIRAMVDILLRRRQNNPLLAGEAGVGKTAVVEGLALAIAREQVPPSLAQVRLLSLDVGALLAGASMKGEFESRLKGVLEEAGKSATPVILFVDEVHTLIGAGGQAGTGDAANLLKPALARGTLRTIGATTWGEYKRHIEQDPALTRRFQVLQVMEPQETAATDMVRGLVPTFTRHHQVLIMESAVRAAVTLSHRYIPSRQLPDKAICLLDTACARVALSLHAPPAQVSFLRERLVAARLEGNLLSREERLGHVDVKRLLEVNTRIADQQQDLEALEVRWQQELAATKAIIALRSRILTLPDEADAVDNIDAADNADNADAIAVRNTLLAELAQLTRQLLESRQDMPLIQAQVDDHAIASIVADWTGIPVGNMVQDEINTVLNLPALLAQRVIGQDHALSSIAERVLTSHAKMADPDKPVGVFLLVGPSGVGKTETALALADLLYGGRQNLITVNMSEFQEAHTVSTLKGAPPGYVGYGEGGVLTEAVRRRPYSVVLLDEIEKAHPDVHEMFYQVFDKGWMEDGQGRHIDFKNSTILLTSNIGSEEIANWHEDASGADPEVLAAELQPALRQVFPAAFLGRVKTVPYLPLATGPLARIVNLHLQKVIHRMQAGHDIALTYSDAVVDRIVSQCGTHETGARLLVGFIEQHLLTRLSGIWLSALQEKRSLASIDVDFAEHAPDGGFIYLCTEAAPPVAASCSL